MGPRSHSGQDSVAVLSSRRIGKALLQAQQGIFLASPVMEIP